MLNRRTALILLVWILLWGTALAIKIDLDPGGNIYHFWLEPSNELKFATSHNPEPQTLYSFTREVNSFDVEVENSIFYLTYSIPDPLYLANKVFLACSKDNGQSFAPPLLLSEKGVNPSLAASEKVLAVAWEEEKGIAFCKSEYEASNFMQNQSILITGETLSSPVLAIDRQNDLELAFLAEDRNLNLKRVYFTALASLEPKVLFESHDELTNLGLKVFSQGILVFWQKEYLQREETYFSLSLDNGKTFSYPKLLEFQKELLDLCFINEKLSALTYKEPVLSQIEGRLSELVIQEIEFASLPSPRLLFPSENTVLSSSNLKLLYSVASSDPFICKIDLSTDENFYDLNTRHFEEFVSSATQEVYQHDFSEELQDGIYFLRTQIRDGLSTSPFSPALAFAIDNTLPQILTLEASRVNDQLSFKGKASEYVSLAINQRLISFEASMGLDSQPCFESQFPLEPGDNPFTFVLIDQAGNTSLLTREVFYNPALPEITVLKPEETEWFRPASTILVEALVSDVQGDILDGSQAEIMIQNQLLEDTLAFDQQESRLFGFITLPAELWDGKYTGSIFLSDISGNKGQADFVIKIDGSPPLVNHPPGEPCFANSQTTLVLPVQDLGAGLDCSGTLIKISGISLEGRVSVESEGLKVYSNLPLAEGTYEVEVAARDKIGNIAEPVSFSLIVDTTPPHLTLLGSPEPHTQETEITLQGNVEEAYPSTINIYNNQQSIKSFSLCENYFSEKIRLLPGQNAIQVEVLDKSGNKAGAGLEIFADLPIASASGLIAKCVNGPNPFSPAQSLPGAYAAHGNGMVFAYELSQPADIQIRIYDLTGTLIWTREIRNASSGVTAWGGIDNFGEVAKNGIYPYIFSARGGGKTEIRRGKIIVYQP